MRTIVVQAWTVHKGQDGYYLPYSHWVYLKEIVQYFDKVYLLSPVKKDSGSKLDSLINIANFENVVVNELPYSDGYISAIKHIGSYISAYKAMRDIDVVYARYPIPFGWLQKVYLKKSKRIIHFVGDPVDTVKNNHNLNYFKKRMLINLFYPEHALYLWACKGAQVYTNGTHIANKLERKGIKATALVSSTLKTEDFSIDTEKVINKEFPRILYVGYLRKAKGVETVLSSFISLQKKIPGAQLTIVGSGELEGQLINSVSDLNVKNVTFMGHIDNRQVLNNIFRSNDIFCFGSLSEGSPRVILEAMANGIAVVSTPVGSLPYIFTDNKHIAFSDFNDDQMFSKKLYELINDPEKVKSMKSNAYNKVKEFTIDKFLKTIFYED